MPPPGGSCTLARMLIPLLVVSGVLILGGLWAVRARRPQLGWTGIGVGALLLVGLFTVRMAAPNVVSAGQKATERMAVSQLRTLVWAQEQFVRGAGRAGLIDEMAGLRPSPLSAPVLRPTFQRQLPVPGGAAAGVSGYAFRVFIVGPDGAIYTDGGATDVPPGATHWIAYAWPEKRGVSANAVFCVNAAEDVLQSANPTGYDGITRVPGLDACPQKNGRLVPGKGGDGADWVIWRGERTRRARAADVTPPGVKAAPSAPRSASTP